jgi:Mce-associated membrane protein
VTAQDDLPAGLSPASRRGGRLLVLLALVTGLAVAGATYEGLRLRHLDGQESDRRAAKTAAQLAIGAFTTFDYRHIEADIARGKQVMTPCFGEVYGKNLQTAVPTATAAKAVVTDVVQGTQVITIKGARAQVLVFFDQKGEFGDGRPTKVTPYRVVVDMVRKGDRWLVNYLDLGEGGSGIDASGKAAVKPCG